MTPAQLTLLLHGEAVLLGDKTATPDLPPMSDADDLAAFDGRL